nr:acyltransferase [Eubacterium sp.]
MGILFGGFLLLLLLSAFGVGKPNTDCLSRDMTTTINGYFLTTVFMTHFIQYLSADMYNAVDWAYIYTNRALGQLIVALFLFYSGYGVMESLKHKEGYIKTFPLKRILTLVVDFEIAAVIYLIVSCATGQPPTVRYAIEAFFAWESLGNSNWYVFAILYLYIATYFSFRFIPSRLTRGRGISIALVFLFSVFYMWFMERHKGGWWYDTVLCYTAGMIFSCFADRFRHIFCTKNRKWYAVACLSLLVAFAVTYHFRSKSVWCFELLSILFALLFVFATVRMKASSPLYSYLGKNLFCYYIYQRIPMIIFKDTLGTYNIYLYFLVCVVITIAICQLMIPLYGKIHKQFDKITKGLSL